MSGSAHETVWKRHEWISLGIAIVIAHLFYWRIVVYPSEFDARNYFDIAADIDRNGLFSRFYYSDVRTYGYPLLLAALSRVANLARVPLPLLLLACPAAMVATRELVRVNRHPRIGALASIAIVSYVAVALTLSDWVRQQAPSSRAWEAAHAASAAK